MENNYKNSCLNEKGSLALEQVLFIGAVVLLATGLFTFYGELSNYFANFDFSNVGNSVPAAGSGGNTP